MAQCSHCGSVRRRATGAERRGRDDCARTRIKADRGGSVSAGFVAWAAVSCRGSGDGLPARARDSGACQQPHARRLPRHERHAPHGLLAGNPRLLRPLRRQRRHLHGARSDGRARTGDDDDGRARSEDRRGRRGDHPRHLGRPLVLGGALLRPLHAQHRRWPDVRDAEGRLFDVGNRRRHRDSRSRGQRRRLLARNGRSRGRPSPRPRGSTRRARPTTEPPSAPANASTSRTTPTLPARCA